MPLKIIQLALKFFKKAPEILQEKVKTRKFSIDGANINVPHYLKTFNISSNKIIHYRVFNFEYIISEME